MSFGRILSLLVVLGLVVAPAGMAAGGPAMSGHGAAMAMSHDSMLPVHPCTDKQRPADKKAPDACCVMMCIAIPAAGGALAVQSILPRERQPLPRLNGPPGLHPEADPPPPRFS